MSAYAPWDNTKGDVPSAFDMMGLRRFTFSVEEIHNDEHSTQSAEKPEDAGSRAEDANASVKAVITIVDALRAKARADRGGDAQDTTRTHGWPEECSLASLLEATAVTSRATVKRILHHTGYKMPKVGNQDDDMLSDVAWDKAVDKAAIEVAKLLLREDGRFQLGSRPDVCEWTWRPVEGRFGI